ncbi:MAG: hypothetical protein ACKN9V_01950 [Pseudomonadota bacterium]
MFGNKKSFEVFPSLIILVASALITIVLKPQSYQRPSVLRVAHAGGELIDMKMTNSLDALNANERVFDFFEIDLNFTQDGRLVCLHDWAESFEYTFGFKIKEPLTYDEFIDLVRKNKKFTNCTLESLMVWLSKHPTKKLVTDVKDNNIGALKVISDKYPQYLNQVIPQIYSPDEYYPIWKMGYRDIIFTVYRFGFDKQKIIKAVNRYDLFAITMPASGVPILGKLLNDLKIPIYVHTINSTEDANTLLSGGVSEIYTDNLRPTAMKSSETSG